MRSVHYHDVAQLLERPEDRIRIARECRRTGWTVLPQIEERILTKVTRYQTSYFRWLLEENRLPAMSEDQLVIGLD